MGRIPCWRCNRKAGRLGSPASEREAGCPVQRMAGEAGGCAMLPWPGWPWAVPMLRFTLPQERCKWDKSHKRRFMRFCKRLGHLIVRLRGRICFHEEAGPANQLFCGILGAIILALGPVVCICLPTLLCHIFLWNTLPSSSAIYVQFFSGDSDLKSSFFWKLFLDWPPLILIGPFLEASGLQIYAMYYFSVDCLQTPFFKQYIWGSLSCNCVSVGLYFISVRYSYLLIKILNTAKP